MTRTKAAVFALCLSWPVVASAGEVTKLVLVDADTDRDIRPLVDGATLDLAADGGALNVRAEVSGKVGSVRFEIDGRTVQTESTPPFALAGDRSGDYSSWQIGPGKHTLTATPYARARGGGEAGKAMRIRFTVVGRASAAARRGSGGRAKGKRRADRGSGGARKVAPAKPVPPAVTLKPGTVTVSGERKQWHKVTIAFAGPAASETAEPNPFTDYRLTVTFRNGGTVRVVPGYYAADGNAARSGAASGNVWMAHLCPNKTGTWTWAASFRKGPGVATADDPGAGEAAGQVDGQTGQFTVAATDKTGRDHRGKGGLEYVGERYLRFAGSGEYFLKCGADAPENLLAYRDFDGPFKNDGQKDQFVKSWAAHVKDWRPGDPTWGGARGKGLIGALNYLASEGLNAVSFLTLNIGGDDRNVFPYTTYDERERMDCSRLAQWEMVFEHADRLGLYLHFKTLETENELLLDNGDLGSQRKLYYRELIARFSHHLALNWNLGEEINNASTSQKKSWARYFHEQDPYRRLIVIHNGANHYDLMGKDSKLTGFSLQTNRPDFSRVHTRTLDYINRSAKAGKQWVVACDEPGDASHALRPDSDAGSSHVDGRKNALWGNIMAGGAGLEFYFGYRHAHSDLTCQDYRSRDRFWDYCRYALEFFRGNKIPFWEMASADGLVGNAKGDNTRYCFAKPGEVYVVYLAKGGSAEVDLRKARGTFTVQWYNPRKGGKLQGGSVRQVEGGASVRTGRPPADPDEDWVVLIRR